MKTDRETLFGSLEPPRGGAERLQARLRAHQPHLLTRPRFAVTAVFALLVVGTVLVKRPTSGPALVDPLAEIDLPPESDRLLGRTSEPFELRVSRQDERLDFEELASSDPKIRIYRLR
jgi:hypothetical protein